MLFKVKVQLVLLAAVIALAGAFYQFSQFYSEYIQDRYSFVSVLQLHNNLYFMSNCLWNNVCGLPDVSLQRW